MLPGLLSGLAGESQAFRWGHFFEQDNEGAVAGFHRRVKFLAKTGESDGHVCNHERLRSDGLVQSGLHLAHLAHVGLHAAKVCVESRLQRTTSFAFHAMYQAPDGEHGIRYWLGLHACRTACKKADQRKIAGD